MVLSNIKFMKEVERIHEQSLLAQIRLNDRMKQRTLQGIELSRMELHELIDQSIDNIVLMIQNERTKKT